MKLPIITKQYLCREMITLFYQTEGIDESILNDNHCYLSSTVGVSMEVLGLIESEKVKEYVASRGGIAGISNMKFGSFPKVHSFREVLEHLPDEGEL